MASFENPDRYPVTLIPKTTVTINGTVWDVSVPAGWQQVELDIIEMTCPSIVTTNYQGRINGGPLTTNVQQGINSIGAPFTAGTRLWGSSAGGRSKAQVRFMLCKDSDEVFVKCEAVSILTAGAHNFSHGGGDRASITEITSVGLQTATASGIGVVTYALYGLHRV